jgi:hypothetical protein
MLPAIFVLAAAGANAGAPTGMPAANAQELIHRPQILDLGAPHMQSVSELLRPLRFDQVRGSSAGASTTRQFTQTALDAGFGSKSALAIHWRTKPELVRMARNFRRTGLPIVSLWHSGRGLIALGLSPRGVPGLYFTQARE